MSLADTYAPDVERAQKPRRWASTLTPEAEKDMARAMARMVRAQRELNEATRDRDETLERHHALGVDPRDLAPLTETEEWPAMHVASVSRLIKAVRDRREQAEGAAGGATAGGQ